MQKEWKRSGTLPPLLFMVIVVAGILGVRVGFSHAVPPYETIVISPDITVNLGGAIVDPESVAIDDGTVLPFDVGTTLPRGVHITAYHMEENGDQLVAFDSTVLLNEDTVHALTVFPGDVVRFDGKVFTLEFQSSAHKVPDGVMVDAVGRDGTGLLLSFDTTVAVSGVIVGEEDLVLVDESGAVGIYFEGLESGIHPGLNLDGVHHLGNNTLLLSFDGSGAALGVRFEQEDVVEFSHTPRGGLWHPEGLAYDGSAQHAGWAGGNLTALAVGPVVVNSSLRLDKTFQDGLPSNNVTDPFGLCTPSGLPKPIFAVNPQFTNVSIHTLKSLKFVVTTLTGGNTLINADGAPPAGGVRSTVTVPQQELGTDGILSPRENFLDPGFLICLKTENKFQFFVDVIGFQKP